MNFWGPTGQKFQIFPRCFMGGIDSKNLAVPRIETIGGSGSRASSNDVIYEGAISLGLLSQLSVHKLSQDLVCLKDNYLYICI